MSLLILNAGSSSLKFTLMEVADHHVWMQDTVELDAALDAGAARPEEALERIVASVRDRSSVAIDTVAHRVVHGGARFTAPVRITPEVRAALAELNELAPLHNPPSLAVIDAAMTLLPDVPH